MVTMTPTQLKWRNVVLLCVAIVGLVLLYLMSFPIGCGWRRLHRIFDPTKNVPVFVTGGDFKTYEISKLFLQDLYRVQNKRYWGLQVVYIDLGLTLDQLLDLDEICSPCECVVKRIPELTHFLKSTDVEPGFTETMIIKNIYNEYPFFMWIDSSTRLNLREVFTDLFNKTVKNGLQIAVGKGLIDDDFGLTADHFRIIGENPIYYTSKPTLDTSWMLVGELDGRVDEVLHEHFICVEQSVCFRKNVNKLCKSDQQIFSVRQCQAILAVKLNKEFDDCYRSYAFSMERYVLKTIPRCVISSANGF